MNQTKDELLTAVYKYEGKTLGKEGTSAGGKAWKIWKLQFDSGMQYPYMFSMFDPGCDKGVLIKDMEEGQFYEVLYKVTSYVGQYGPAESKTAVLIKEATSDQASNNTPQPQSTSQKENNQGGVPSHPLHLMTFNQEEFDSFVEEYTTTVTDKNLVNRPHMLGVYVMNYYAEEFSEVMAQIKKVMAKPVVGEEVVG